MPPRQRPVGTVTRGTTNPNRLRRCDRWIAGAAGVAAAAQPDAARRRRPRLRRLARHRASSCTTGCGGCAPDVEVVGIEIDPARVAAGKPLERDGPAASGSAGSRSRSTAGARPTVVRAFNVLRQYAEDEVPAPGHLVRERLAPDGLLVDGTCDEIGRRAAWVAVDARGPVSLTISLRLGGLERPSDVAERLPEGAHPPQRARASRSTPSSPTSTGRGPGSAPQSSWGARQRFLAAVRRGAGALAAARRTVPVAARRAHRRLVGRGPLER